MSAQHRIDAFFTLADRVLRIANVLFRENLFEDATLYVQQVVERVARALLTHAGVAFGTSHNLAQMAEALPLEHPFRERIRAFDAFSSAVTAFRYPTSTGRLQQPPQTGELRRTIEEAEQLVSDSKEYIYDSRGDSSIGRRK
jgi:HEPN domain-containing protein